MNTVDVPLLDLKGQYAAIKDEIMEEFSDIIDTCQFILGRRVEQLENNIASAHNCHTGIGVSSGTDALLISLMAADVGHGDEVITTPFSFFATMGSILRTGATPVFVDINPDTFNIDETKIEAAITSKTKAIIPVHMYGQMCQMEPIMTIAKAHNLTVIEDAAQAIGASINGHMAGSVGHTGCFSFYPTKNLGASGDAGMVVTTDPKLGEKIKQLRTHGEVTRYHHKYIGGNFRMDGFEAAVLLIKFRAIQNDIARLNEIATRYTNELTSKVVVPVKQENVTHVYHQYTIKTDKRNELKDYLASQKVASNIFYPVPLHLQECIADLGYKEGDLPVSEEVTSQVLSLPIFAEMRDDQVDAVIATVNGFFEG
jgi:dTDP-4-amino-4,6-dideoxygalactose transaminase